MSQNRDDDEHDRPSQPADHMARRLDAFRSDWIQSLVENVLIVEGQPGEGDVLASLLRALLGRQVEARRAFGAGGALAAIATDSPKLVLWRDAGGGAPSEDGIQRLRGAGFAGPVVVVIDRLPALLAIRLRKAGALDVIEKDDLDSVRLADALFAAGGRAPPPSWKAAAF